MLLNTPFLNEHGLVLINGGVLIHMFTSKCYISTEDQFLGGFSQLDIFFFIEKLLLVSSCVHMSKQSEWLTNEPADFS